MVDLSTCQVRIFIIIVDHHFLFLVDSLFIFSTFHKKDKLFFKFKLPSSKKILWIFIKLKILISKWDSNFRYIFWCRSNHFHTMYLLLISTNERNGTRTSSALVLLGDYSSNCAIDLENSRRGEQISFSTKRIHDIDSVSYTHLTLPTIYSV